VLCNTPWINLLPGSYCEYLSHSTSGHSPVLMFLLDKQLYDKKPFKFYHYWMNALGFMKLSVELGMSTLMVTRSIG